MFDIGGLELLVLAVILIVVVGPKELPAMLRVFGRTVAKVRGIAAEFRGQFDEALREAELDEVRKTVSDVGKGVNKLNPKTAMQEAMKPFKDAGAGLKRDLEANAAVDLDDPPAFDPEHDLGPEMEGPAMEGRANGSNGANDPSGANGRNGVDGTKGANGTTAADKAPPQSPPPPMEAPVTLSDDVAGTNGRTAEAREA